MIVRTNCPSEKRFHWADPIFGRFSFMVLYTILGPCAWQDKENGMMVRANAMYLTRIRAARRGSITTLIKIRIDHRRSAPDWEGASRRAEVASGEDSGGKSGRRICGNLELAGRFGWGRDIHQSSRRFVFPRVVHVAPTLSSLAHSGLRLPDAWRKYLLP
ncbi:hypothetical protein Mp_3g14040 [Marchantia polymorpha subsp. ruderalis]|uniref:Uncharacterized protein n=2 Tax=Marchantia polymorpha TaxID=3197 RepID=A0AAF6B0L0_MARPO|nr:hypothetical protein MARPO_0004s0267 [Marchantia polymorpha]BBN05544.1 hypothetical protein Mp_3g14040 [Marchantia polymorpha subsp. ruderalis]|eukprot:PTQ49040.1 hypothetical protein MARPO_0004s0267 [Marchantia polymorpha]